MGDSFPRREDNIYEGLTIEGSMAILNFESRLYGWNGEDKVKEPLNGSGEMGRV